MDTINKREKEKFNNEFKFFLGSLPGNLDENLLLNYFSDFGKIISLEIIKNPKTNLSKGFGFLVINLNITLVEFTSSIHTFNNRNISVRRYLKGKELENNVQSIMSKRLFIKRIPEWIVEKDIKEYFQQFGNIEMVYLTQNYAVKQIKSLIGFVHFELEYSINKVLESEIHYVKNAALRCSIYDPKKNKPAIPFLDSNKRGNKYESSKDAFNSCNGNGAKQELNWENRGLGQNKVKGPINNKSSTRSQNQGGDCSLNLEEIMPVDIKELHKQNKEVYLNSNCLNTCLKKEERTSRNAKPSIEGHRSKEQKKQMIASCNFDHTSKNIRFNLELDAMRLLSPRSNKTELLNTAVIKRNSVKPLSCLRNEIKPKEIRLICTDA